MMEAWMKMVAHLGAARWGELWADEIMCWHQAQRKAKERVLSLKKRMKS